MTNLLTIIVVLFFVCPYLWVLLIAKTSREVFYAGLCGVVRRDRFWWRAAADFWDRL